MAKEPGAPPRPPSTRSRAVEVNPARAIEVAEGVTSPLSQRFEVAQLLGEGGMGRVLVAHDRGLGRSVALKQLRETMQGNPDALRRFVLEAQVGAQLEHPNIVPLYSFERSGEGQPAFAMRLVEGKTMASMTWDARLAPPEARSPRGVFSLKERVSTLLGVCDAIHFAHERGVVHRDLKPENVMLGAYREVYVMDWGLAKVVGAPASAVAPGAPAASPAAPADLPPTHQPGEPPGLAPTFRPATAEAPHVDFAPGDTLPSSPKVDGDHTSSATRLGQVMGTLQYMAPEQAQGRTAEVGPAADQFSLGLMLLELGTLSMTRATDVNLAFGQAREGFTGPTAPKDSDGQPLPPAMVAIVRRATQLDAGARYPSVAALADDLRRFVRDEPVSVYAEGPARRAIRLAARHPALSVGAVAAVLLTAASALIVSLAAREQEAERHARAMEGLRTVLVAVSERVHFVDARLSTVAARVQAVAGAAIELEEQAVAGPPPGVPSPDDLVPNPRYGTKVSFARALSWWPGQAGGTPPPTGAGRLGLLHRWLRLTVVESLPSAEAAALPPAQELSLTAGHALLLRAFVGFDDGRFSQYPAREVPDDYDPRERAWFQQARREKRLRWTPPLVDMSRATLRLQAVQPLWSNGRYLGAAGCDVRVSELAKTLALALPGFRRASLVTPDGRVTVSEDLEARVLGATSEEADGTLATLPRTDDTVLLDRLARGDAGGYHVRPDGTLVVWSRLVSPAWAYVAELDAATWLPAD
jgi:serine/threonine protein kinase